MKPICLFDASKDEELIESFSSKNTQPLFKEIHKKKGFKYSFSDYQIHFLKAYQFLRLNEEGLNQKKF